MKSNLKVSFFAFLTAEPLSRSHTHKRKENAFRKNFQRKKKLSHVQNKKKFSSYHTDSLSKSTGKEEERKLLLRNENSLEVHRSK